jgi:hypothetical protein
MPQQLQLVKEIVYRREAKKTFAELPGGGDCGLQEFVAIRGREGQLLTYHHLARRPCQRSPFPVADLLGKQGFHLAAAWSQAHPKQSCRNDTAVVQHQHIACPQ